MASVVFVREPVTHALLTEALPLLAEHWGEVSHYPDIPLNVDVDGYLAVAQSIRCYTVRTQVPQRGMLTDDAMMLVGYALFFVRANLHYSQSTQAVQDVVYLHPSVRGGTGARFLAYCDEQLAAEGVQVVYHHAKLAHPQLAGALTRLGYAPVETIYGKRLDGGHTPEGTAAARDQHASVPAGGAAVQSTPRRRWSDVDETNDLARTSRGTHLPVAQWRLTNPDALTLIGERADDLTDFTDLMHASADAWNGEDGG